MRLFSPEERAHCLHAAQKDILCLPMWSRWGVSQTARPAQLKKCDNLCIHKIPLFELILVVGIADQSPETLHLTVMDREEHGQHQFPSLWAFWIKTLHLCCNVWRTFDQGQDWIPKKLFARTMQNHYWLLQTWSLNYRILTSLLFHPLTDF